MRLGVARLWHEGNSFSPVATRLADFRRREWFRGEAARDFYRGTATEIGAAIAFAERQPDWQVELLPCLAAPPGGPVPQEDTDALIAEILSAIRGQAWDAIYLSLHGAMLASVDPAPELTLLRGVRQAIGAKPLAASFDLHANLGPAHLEAVDVALGYKTYPHVDMAETATRALDLLAAMATKELKPKGALVKLPFLAPSFAMRTEGDGPMAEIAALARQVAAMPGLLDVTPFGGFAYGDSPYAGPSVMAFAAGDRAAAIAQTAAETVADGFRQRRQRFFVDFPVPEAAIAQALQAPPGLVALIDPADNPLSGGIGDTTGLFTALIRARPPVPTLFAFFHDPDCVAAAHHAGVGAKLQRHLGGRIRPDYGAPVAVAARVAALTDGKFHNRGPMERGLAVDLGRTALLDIEGAGMANLRVIVTETCQTPNDPAYFDLHGIDLTQVRLLAVKAKNHFRAGFGTICAAMIDVDAPGPAGLDLRQFRYRHVPPEYLPRSP